MEGGAPGAGPTANASAPLNGVPGFQAPPTDPNAYQTMYIYVPEGSYTDQSKAIILQVNNGGWMASPARDILTEGRALSSTNDTDNTGAALKAGYIVVSAGTRSRGLQSHSGEWVGKAPAVVVDAKAAIRYLRLNDAVMPGSAERIVITGTSGGGGLSVAVSASGNSPDYIPYLAELGAAGVDDKGQSTVRDDVFATIAYCPINDLGNADLAYEWQYNATRTAANSQEGRYDAAGSAELAAKFPAMLAGLHLTRPDGSNLTADTLPDVILAMVRKSIEAAIARGDKIPAYGENFSITPMGPPGMAPREPRLLKNDWLKVENGQIRSIDYAAFLRFVAANQTLKGVPAFDANTGASKAPMGENSLFGSSKTEYSNFSEYGWNHNAIHHDGSGADDTGMDWATYIAGPGKALAQQIKLVSPMPYLHTTTTVAPYWYVRHGLIDRDTSFATQAILYSAIQDDPKVKEVNFQLAWLRGHSGNYDVQEAYHWLSSVLNKAGPPPAAAR